MTFTFKTEKGYIEAYKAMLRMAAPFSYNRDFREIEVDPQMFDFDLVETSLNNATKWDSVFAGESK